MAFGNQQNAVSQGSAARIASIAGVRNVEATPAAAAAERKLMLEPDLSRIRMRGIEETPVERKRRLAAKTMNFTATFIARFLIMGALLKFGFDVYAMTGTMHRGVVVGLLAMFADFGRVAMKAMEPGTK